MGLTDTFGRTAKDLRLSLTDRCDLRCSYCLPREGVSWLHKTEILNVSEVLRLAKIALRELGITQVRLTGGEPLLRPDLMEIVSGLHEIFLEFGLEPQIAMTTNATRLAGMAREMHRAGVARLNVSLDTLDQKRFIELTGRNQLEAVLAGITEARKVGFSPLKINTVILDEESLSEAPSMLNFCLERDLEWRAIEYMPFGPLPVRRTAPIPIARLWEVLEEGFSFEPLETNPHAPARRFRVTNRDRRRGTMGVIASVSASFCAECNRTRLSASGRVHPCLFSALETDLGSMLRAGATDKQLADAWKKVTLQKPRGHELASPGFQSPTVSMAEIGG